MSSIIGVLASIAIPAFLNQRQISNDVAVKSDVRNIVMQIETILISAPNASFVDNIDIQYQQTDHLVTVVAGTAATDANTLAINISPGVRIGVSGANKTGTGSTNGYLVYGWHNNGKQYKDITTAVVYNSVKGGFTSNLSLT